MNIESTCAVITLAFLVCGFIWKFSTDIAKLSVKVDVMWAFQMRRAVSESIEKGAATFNSPLTFSEDSKRRLEPIKASLIEFWANKGNKLCDGAVLLEIERLFGDDLLERVGVPCRLTHGACLLLALAVAKQSDSLELNLKT